MVFFKEYWKGGEGQTEGAFHSSSFHSYFEGYIEKKQVDPATGRSKIVRIYAAPYHVRSGSDSDWGKAKLRAAVMYVLSVALLILSSSVLELEMPAKYYQIFIAGGLICDFFLLYVLIKFLFAPRKMTIGTFRSFHPTICRLSIAAAVIVFCAVPARLVNMLLSRCPADLSVLMGFLSLAGSGAAMLGLYLQERKALYDTVDNESAEEHGFQIQR